METYYDKQLKAYFKRDGLVDAFKRRRRSTYFKHENENTYTSNVENPIVHELRNNQGVIRVASTLRKLFQNVELASGTGSLGEPFMTAEVFLRSRANAINQANEMMRPTMINGGRSQSSGSRMGRSSFNEIAPSAVNEGVFTVGAVDIQIMSYLDSVWQYFAIDHGMDAPQDRFIFTDLEALNSAAGLAAGDTAWSQITAPSLTLDTSNNSAVTTVTLTDPAKTTPVQLTGPAVPGTVNIFSDAALTLQYGFDNANGGLNVSGLPTSTINYKTGTITLGADFPTGTYYVNYVIDRVDDATGNKVLRLRNTPVVVPLTATPTPLVLESNYMDTLVQNKILNNAKGIYDTQDDFYSRAMSNLRNVDMTAKNNLMVNALIRAVNANKTNITMTDLPSTVKEGSYWDTIEALMKNYMATANINFANRTGKSTTAYLVDSYMASIITTFDNSFSTEGIVTTDGRDGLIGLYQGIPVVRLAGLTNKIDFPGQGPFTDYGVIVGVHKSLDGKMAPCVFGEFVPPVSPIGAGVNPNNPLQSAQTLVSYVAGDVLLPSLCWAMGVKKFSI